MMQTNIPGVWAIGDIRNTPFKQGSRCSFRSLYCSDGDRSIPQEDAFIGKTDERLHAKFEKKTI